MSFPSRVAQLALAVCMSACTLAQAQTAAPPVKPTLPAPLLEAVKKAVATNPEVQAKWNAFLAADSQRDIAKAGFLPQVDLRASAGSEGRTTATANLGTYDLNSARLSLNQILFDGFFTVNEVRRLGAAKLTRYYELLEASETAALEATRAYADVARYRELVELATQNWVEHKQATQLVEERANAGVGRRVDVEQANGRLALAESNLLTELTNLHDVSARYLRVVGNTPPANLAPLPEPFRVGPLPASVDILMRDGMQTSPTLLAAVQNARAGKIGIASSLANFSPRVDLQAYTSQGKNSGGVVGDSSATGVALALNYNLLKGGADTAYVKQTSRLADQARDLQDKSCRDVRQTLSLAYSDVAALNEKLLYIDTHRLATEKTREAYRQQFEIGQRTLLDLLDTQNEFFEASRSYINARHDQAQAQARTLAAMGQLVARMSAQRADVPVAKDVDDDKVDVATFCEGVETRVDTLAEIKSRLTFQTKAKDPSSYVVLLPDENNVVGKVIVDGKGGKQVLDEAQKAAATDGGGSTFAASKEMIDRDFGNVIKALPKAPEKFLLYFERGSNVLTKESRDSLGKIVERAAARAGLDVSVIGHTDTYGSEDVNQKLGLERAQYVTQQLRALGLRTEALVVESFGEKSLQETTPDETKNPRNRRVEVILR